MKGYHLLTAEQRQTILSVYQATLSVTETAKQTGLKVQRVRGCVKRAGIKPSGSHGGKCYRRQVEVRQWLAEGVTFSEIARRIGTNHHRVADFVRRHNIPFVPYNRSGAGNGRWQGGRMIDKSGYVLVKRRDHPHCDRHGYVREHRLVMESVLGRHLLPSEVVHHKDDDKQNNDPSNLELFASNADHLAATIAGQVPRWTPEGVERIRAGVRRGAVRRRSASRAP